MTFKNMIKKLMIIPIMSNSLFVKALEVPQPYMVAATIPGVTLEKEACLVLLRDNPLDFHDENIQATIEAIELEMGKVNNDFQVINQEIVYLETESPDSLEVAQDNLGVILEELYLEYSSSDPEFNQLTEQEQELILAEDEYVQSWLTYIHELDQVILNKVAERDQLEAYYQNLQYDLDNLKQEETNLQVSKDEYNQCLLYPYSAKKQTVDKVLLNNQLSLNDYLIQIDSYLKEMIAIAYSNVKFEDIYQRFITDLTFEELQASYMTKAPIELTEITLDQYSYARELNLKDIQTIVEFGQYKFQEDQDIETYQALYQQVIDLKESQWQYIYQINEVTFENIKEQLANYLNQTNAVEDRDVELVRGLQQRYQVKLVLYNPIDKKWYVNVGHQSGFLEEYQTKEISLETSRDEIVEDEEETSLEARHTQIGNDGGEELPQDIKNKFFNNMERRGQKELPVPRTLNSNDKNKDEKEKPKPPSSVENEAKERESGQFKLPSTGEQRPFTIIAIVLLVLGIALLAVNRTTRKKRQDQLDEIELD